VIFAGEKAALEFLDAGNFESLRLIFAMIWSNLSQFSADFEVMFLVSEQGISMS